MYGIALRVSNMTTKTTGSYPANRFFQELVNRTSCGLEMHYTNNIIISKNILKNINAVILFYKTKDVCEAYLLTNYRMDYNEDRVPDRLHLKIFNCRKLSVGELNSLSMLKVNMSVLDYLKAGIKRENRFYWYIGAN